MIFGIILPPVQPLPLSHVLIPILDHRSKYDYYPYEYEASSGHACPCCHEARCWPILQVLY